MHVIRTLAAQAIDVGLITSDFPILIPFNLCEVLKVLYHCITENIQWNMHAFTHACGKGYQIDYHTLY